MQGEKWKVAYGEMVMLADMDKDERLVCKCASAKVAQRIVADHNALAGWNPEALEGLLIVVKQVSKTYKLPALTERLEALEVQSE